MLSTTRVADEEPSAAQLDVVCAGETRWTLPASRGHLPAPAAMRMRAIGGPMQLALALAKRGLRVGLATVLVDDAPGRASVERLAAAGVNTAGIALAARRPGLVRVDGLPDLGRLPSLVQDERPLEVPARWSSQMLALSGLSPVVAHVAALCRASRAARRAGTTVLLDFDASLHAWSHGDSRVIRMLLREVDVARCSHADLAVLGTDVLTVRAALRPSAVLVVSDDGGRCVATGPFGELTLKRAAPCPPARAGEGSALTAAICVGLLRRPTPGESLESRFRRALGGVRGEG